jgi:hypothetical protein
LAFIDLFADIFLPSIETTATDARTARAHSPSIPEYISLSARSRRQRSSAIVE